MKNTRILLALTAAIVLAGTAPAQTASPAKPPVTRTATRPATKPAAKPAPKIEVPKDAIKNDDGSYAWTDPQGKKWTFISGPFGVTKTPAGASATAKTPGGLPTGATRNPDGTYSYTDKDGAQWSYAMTPFGLSKTAVTPSTGSQPQQPAATGDVKVTDKGDSVRIERKTPFGVSAVEKKKTALTAEERQLVESAKPDAGKVTP